MSNKRQTRRKRLIGGLETLQPNFSHIPTNNLLRTHTLKNFVNPHVFMLKNTSIKPRVNVPTSTSPMNLSQIKSTTSEYIHKYFKTILTKIGMTDVHRMYTDDTRTTKMYIYELDQILPILHKAIQGINTTHSSEDFDFAIDTGNFIIQQLNKYISYTTSKADEFGHIPMDEIEVLFK